VVLGVVSSCRPLSTFLLVVGASGLYTPGPVHLDSVHCPPTLFLLRGICQAAPAQVTACRVVTLYLRELIFIFNFYSLTNKGDIRYFNIVKKVIISS